MADDEEESEAARRAAFSPVLTVDDYRPLSSTVRVECAALSHRGASRVSNDDHYLVMRLGRQQETLATSLSEPRSPRPTAPAPICWCWRSIRFRWRDKSRSTDSAARVRTAADQSISDDPAEPTVQLEDQRRGGDRHRVDEKLRPTRIRT